MSESATLHTHTIPFNDSTMCFMIRIHPSTWARPADPHVADMELFSAPQHSTAHFHVRSDSFDKHEIDLGKSAVSSSAIPYLRSFNSVSAI